MRCTEHGCAIRSATSGQIPVRASFAVAQQHRSGVEGHVVQPGLIECLRRELPERPQPCGRVLRAGEHPPAVRAEGDAQDHVPMAAQH
jgi:hypothetical protein